MRTKREDIRWALVENEALIDDIDGVVVFETRKEAREYRDRWARFYKHQQIKRQPPKVVKVRVVVAVIKRDGKPQEPEDDS